jgi:hypothetical protein
MDRHTDRLKYRRFIIKRKNLSEYICLVAGLHRGSSNIGIHIWRFDAHKIMAHGSSCSSWTYTSYRNWYAYTWHTNRSQHDWSADKKYNQTRNYQFHIELSSSKYNFFHNFFVTFLTIDFILALRDFGTNARTYVET